MSRKTNPNSSFTAPTRRKIIKAGAAAAGVAFTTNIIAAPRRGAVAAPTGAPIGDDPLFAPTNCPDVIQNLAVPRWVDPLPIAETLVPMSQGTVPTLYGSEVGDVHHGVAPEWYNTPEDWNAPRTEYYQMNHRPGRGQLLPSTMGLSTDFWGYAGRRPDGSWKPASSPGPTLRFNTGTPALVRVGNDLPEEMSVHMHGGHWPAHSDGHPSFLVLPDQSRDYYYPNILPRVHGGNSGAFDTSEAPSTMWYHDHAVHLTAQHVARGMAGMCIGLDDLEKNLITTGVLPGIPGVSDVGPKYDNPYDIPLMFLDRLFDPSGNICYDGNDHDGYLGNVVLCNGKAYPFLKVERRKYRFRVLLCGNSRIWRLRLSDNSTFLRLGKDAWLFPKPQEVQAFLGAPATRADIVIDFTKYKAGDEVYFENIIDQQNPRGAGSSLEAENSEVVSGIPAFRHRILKFVVQERDLRYADATVNTNTMLRPNVPIEAGEIVARRHFKFERKNGAWAINSLFYDERTANATPTVNTAEEWTLQNGSGGWWHPIHIHLESHQQVADRRTRKPIPYHDKFKSDSTILGPNSQIVIRMKFRTFLGPFVFHCHNVEHEDMDMMFQFDPRAVATQSPQPVQRFFP
jgi:FtsP/CotA-like multicopper oxidase with cupredoxin domain